MSKTTLSIFSFILVLFVISLSSALCLNCNQQNPQVQYYQNANGCSVYSPSPTYQVFNTKPTYSINQPYSRYSMVQYHQEYRNHRHYDYREESNSNSQESKCNWHMSFYRSC